MPRSTSPRRSRAARGSRRGSTASRTSGRRTNRHGRLGRRVLFAAALVGALALTTGLLSLLSPRPLAPDVSGTLFASAESTRLLDLEPAFTTRVPLRRGYWTGIVVRESDSLRGDAATLAEIARARGVAGPPDHFIIGNGLGMRDGEVQFTARWADQAAAPAVAEQSWISICVIADSPRQPLTTAQQARLEQLISSLRRRLDLPDDCVIAPPAIRSVLSPSD